MRLGTLLLILLSLWVGLEAGYRIGHKQGEQAVSDSF